MDTAIQAAQVVDPALLPPLPQEVALDVSYIESLLTTAAQASASGSETTLWIILGYIVLRDLLKRIKFKQLFE